MTLVATHCRHTVGRHSAGDERRRASDPMETGAAAELQRRLPQLHRPFGSTVTGAVPDCVIPRSCAAFFETSICRSVRVGPRSVISTSVDRPVLWLVTVAWEPRGRSREAAVFLSGSTGL